MPTEITVKDIVKQYLRNNGYDGLGHEDSECACDIDNLMWCGADGISECVPAYRWECEEDECCDDPVCEGERECFRKEPQPER